MITLEEYNSIIDEVRNTEDKDGAVANLATLAQNYQEAMETIASRDADLAKASEKINVLNDNNTELLLKVTKQNNNPAHTYEPAEGQKKEKIDWAGNLFKGGSMFNV